MEWANTNTRSNATDDLPLRALSLSFLVFKDDANHYRATNQANRIEHTHTWTYSLGTRELPSPLLLPLPLCVGTTNTQTNTTTTNNNNKRCNDEQSRLGVEQT